jgi:hypothetical protein
MARSVHGARGGSRRRRVGAHWLYKPTYPAPAAVTCRLGGRGWACTTTSAGRTDSVRFACGDAGTACAAWGVSSMVEQWTFNPLVQGSSPWRPTYEITWPWPG